MFTYFFHRWGQVWHFKFNVVWEREVPYWQVSTSDVVDVGHSGSSKTSLQHGKSLAHTLTLSRHE